MDKSTKKLMLYNDPFYDDFSLDVLRMSRHAIERAKERKIPVAELLQPKSHINGYVDRVVSKGGLVITAYPRAVRTFELPENGKRFTFPVDGIAIFIGKQHANINRTQNEYQLKMLYFDKYSHLIAVAPTSDYDWKPFEDMVEKARKRKYKSKQQLSKTNNEKK